MTQFTGSLSQEKTSTRAIKSGILKGVLALQHLIAMFGATVLVPILTGLDPSVALFSAGAGTLIFHLCTKGKVPVFLGSSFAFIPVITAVATQYGDLRYAQGGIMVVGVIYVAVSFLIKKIGLDKIKKVLPAQVVGPMIIVIGLNLIPTALDMAGVNALFAGTEGAILNVGIALITLTIALVIKKFGKGFLSQVSILIAVVVGYLISLASGLVSISEIQSASLVAIPHFTLPKFDMGAIMIIAPVVLAVFMEHVGDITTNGEVVGKNFIEDPGLNRTLLGDGLATLIAGFVGGPANTTYGENTGVLAMTKNYNPAILRITAVFAIILSFIAKFGATIRTIPQCVMGGISLILFSMIALVGFQTIKREKVKFNIVNTLVIATILFIGLSGNFFNNPIGIKITETVSISGLSLAALIGVTLNIVLGWFENLIKNIRK
ncbi:uracil-xanthine permease family protein [Clostridium celatum]|uniref:Putative uracil permease n=1 Tax=Clostridium celatum DSM 1785 TaxID=545697 RepID=L1QHD6_9CLOT|nr:uracil-xanthine permease family protein [Clostridium celatum]EKY27373.1 putative uracil permease [Clostridium celatum DSM 1785]MCE9655838.1 uracil-xanthine permease family protein [Clostridium celatum]MDU6295758.1 uracil-xanthine permease family protein [Clostridium celatum]MDY3358920.1 uracil-xanthine permease family protein [Clostridium celatum]